MKEPWVSVEDLQDTYRWMHGRELSDENAKEMQIRAMAAMTERYNRRLEEINREVPDHK